MGDPAGRSRLRDAPPGLKAAIANANLVYFGRDRAMRRTIIDELARRAARCRSPTPTSPTCDIAGLQSLMNVAKSAFDLTAAHAAEQAQAADRQFAGAVAFMVLAVVFGLFMLYYIVMRAARPGRRGCPCPSSRSPMATSALKFPTSTVPTRSANWPARSGVFRDNALAKQTIEHELVASRVAKEAAEAASLAEVAVPRQYEPRDPHAAERHAGHGAGAGDGAAEPVSAPARRARSANPARRCCRSSTTSSTSPRSRPGSSNSASRNSTSRRRSGP